MHAAEMTEVPVRAAVPTVTAEQCSDCATAKQREAILSVLGMIRVRTLRTLEMMQNCFEPHSPLYV